MGASISTSGGWRRSRGASFGGLVVTLEGSAGDLKFPLIDLADRRGVINHHSMRPGQVYRCYG